MKKAVIYLRVSTGAQVEGASLDSQLSECQRWAARNNVLIAATFTEKGASAKNMNRPKLQEMIRYLHKNKGDTDYLLTYQTDRISRNIEDFYAIRTILSSLGVEYKNANSSLVDNASDKVMTGIQAVMAEHDNLLKSERTSLNMRRHAAEGERMHKAPYGLMNSRDAMNKASIEPVPELSELVAYLLNEFAKSIYNIKELLELSHKLGLKNTKGAPMTYQLLGKILRNPIYAGLEKSKLTGGKLAPSNFNGIISPSVYYRNQELLVSRKTDDVNGYVINHPQYPLRRFVKCGSCKMPLRGSAPKGRGGRTYPKYHCSNKDCAETSINTESLDNLFATLLSSFELDDRATQLYKTLVIRAWNDELKSILTRKKRIQDRLHHLESSKQKVIEKLINDEITADEKVEFTAATNIEIEKLTSELEQMNKATNDKQQVIDYGFSFLINSASFWRDTGIDMQVKYQSMLFPDGIEYDFTAKQFRTTKICELYRLASIKKDPTTADESLLVNYIKSNWKHIKEELLAWYTLLGSQQLTSPSQV